MKKLIALFVLLGVVLATPAYSADDTAGRFAVGTPAQED